MNLIKVPHQEVIEFVPIIFGFRTKNVESSYQSEDTTTLRSLHEQVIRWCINNEFLISTSNGERYVPNIVNGNMDTKLQEFIYSINLKQLCIKRRLDEALLVFSDTEYDRTMSRLIDLHVLIVTELDSRFINIYINKLIYVLSSIYKDDEDADLKWIDIFKNYPYLWLVFVIQNIMRTSSPMPSEE